MLARGICAPSAGSIKNTHMASALAPLLRASWGGSSTGSITPISSIAAPSSSSFLPRSTSATTLSSTSTRPIAQAQHLPRNASSSLQLSASSSSGFSPAALSHPSCLATSSSSSSFPSRPPASLTVDGTSSSPLCIDLPSTDSADGRAVHKLGVSSHFCGSLSAAAAPPHASSNPLSHHQEQSRRHGTAAVPAIACREKNISSFFCRSDREGDYSDSISRLSTPLVSSTRLVSAPLVSACSRGMVPDRGVRGYCSTGNSCTSSYHHTSSSSSGKRGVCDHAAGVGSTGVGKASSGIGELRRAVLSPSLRSVAASRVSVASVGGGSGNGSGRVGGLGMHSKGGDLSLSAPSLPSSSRNASAMTTGPLDQIVNASSGDDLTVEAAANSGTLTALNGMETKAAAAAAAVTELDSMDWPPIPTGVDPSRFRNLHDHPPWDDDIWASPLEAKKQIFCNRSLNMMSIRAVGFDMDYTLAQYRPETFEKLAYELTLDKLVRVFGYPEEILAWQFDWNYMTRGLVIDKHRGNILKIDRHKYVKIAYHGFKELPRDERIATYGTTATSLDFDEPNFALIDTLFSLGEAYLFCQLVELMDSKPQRIPPGKTYADLYRDVRAAVDHCHRDGSLKRTVAADPAKFIHADPALVPLLHMLRASGRSLFIVTNSLWDYTNVVMNYLCGKDGKSVARDHEWLELFDVVIVGSAKPAFFIDMRAQLFEVHTPTGMLMNTDNGTPLAQVGEVIAPPPHPADVESHGKAKRAKVYQGGNFSYLHSMLRVPAGSQVLYVGDHIYGDIIRSKKTLGWRTMLIVPELEKELETQSRNPIKKSKKLREQSESLEDQIQRLDWSLNRGKHDRHETLRIQSHLHALRAQREELKIELKAAERAYNEQFHPVWGQLMKTGNQNSRFAHQVERFACLYTSAVSNLQYYSPDKSYHSPEDVLPHDQLSYPVITSSYTAEQLKDD